MKEYTIGQFNEFLPTAMDEVSLAKTVGDASVLSVSGCVYNKRFTVVRYLSVPVSRQVSHWMRLPWLYFKLNTRNMLDLLHCHSPFSAVKYALRMSRRKGIPIVATFHPAHCQNVLRSVRPSTAKRMIRRMVNFFSSVDEVWVAGAVAEDALRKYGFFGRVTVMDDLRGMNRHYMAVMQRKKRELLYQKRRIPWPEKIWPDPVFELNEQ